MPLWEDCANRPDPWITKFKGYAQWQNLPDDQAQHYIDEHQVWLRVDREYCERQNTDALGRRS
jgi:hypothetical protein